MLSRTVTLQKLLLACYTFACYLSKRVRVSVRFRMRLALGTVLLWFIGTGRATPTEAEIAPLGWASKIEVRQPIPNTAHAHSPLSGCSP